MRVIKHGEEITSIGHNGETILPDEDGAFTVPNELGQHLIRFGWSETGSLPEKKPVGFTAEPKPKATRKPRAPKAEEPADE